jgi:hypothetical protein
MPAALTHFFSSLRYSPLFALAPLRSLFTSTPTPTQPTVQRYLLRPVFAGAARECPTPVILVRATGLANAYPSLAAARAKDDNSDSTSWEDWGGMFAEKGYTALEVDIAAPAEVDMSDPAAPSPLKAMSTLLASQIRLLAIPFPPILISSGDSCLLTQMYIEDNPASGLVLIDPQADNVGESSGKGEKALPMFGYEPRFPILLMGSKGRMGDVESSRLGKAAANGRSRGGKGVMVEEAVDGERGEKSRIVSASIMAFESSFCYATLTNNDR